MKLKLTGLLLLAAMLMPPVWADPEVNDETTEQEISGVEDGGQGGVDNTKPLPKSAKAPRKLEGGWVLEWNDEFNGTRLDTKNWTCELGTVRNKGAFQAYVESCVKVKDGVLQLISKAERTRNPSYGKPAPVAPWDSQTKERPFASGSVTTKGNRTFSPPGRLEFRARIPKAKGVWPAIWTMHQNKYGWPANGEIDILEHVSQEPNTVYSIFRWGQEGKPHGDKEHKVIRRTQIPEYSKEFHTYVLEWDKEYMRVLIDDKEVGRIAMDDAKYSNGDNPLLSPCYIIMNTAIGGQGTWPVKADDPSQYPVTFEIDYVRYYKRSGNAKTADSDEGGDEEASAKGGKKGGKKTSAKSPKPAKGKKK